MQRPQTHRPGSLRFGSFDYIRAMNDLRRALNFLRVRLHRFFGRHYRGRNQQGYNCGVFHKHKMGIESRAWSFKFFWSWEAGS